MQRQNLGLLDLAKEAWYRLVDFGWPFNRMSEKSEVCVVPIPNAAYASGIREAGNASGVPLDDPGYILAVERALPAIYANAVMLSMRGVTLEADGRELEDTAANRELVLASSPLLMDKIARLAQHGPMCESWRDEALRYREVVQQIDAILASAAADESVSSEEVLVALRGRLEVWKAAGISLRTMDGRDEVPS